jgi:hypothetical protein
MPTRCGSRRGLSNTTGSSRRAPRRRLAAQAAYRRRGKVSSDDHQPRRRLRGPAVLAAGQAAVHQAGQGRMGDQPQLRSCRYPAAAEPDARPDRRIVDVRIRRRRVEHDEQSPWCLGVRRNGPVQRDHNNLIFLAKIGHGVGSQSVPIGTLLLRCCLSAYQASRAKTWRGPGSLLFHILGLVRLFPVAPRPLRHYVRAPNVGLQDSL